MTCHTCKHALMRSERPDKHFVYECCEIGIIPMVPQLPTIGHDCQSWEQGEVKAIMGITFEFGEDIEL